MAAASSALKGELPVPPSIPTWLSAQRLEVLVAQRTDELERKIERLLARQAELEILANHDSLTGLASRRLLGDRFQCAVERAKRSGMPFALLVIDLDDFKCINDTYGHAAGDTVLVEVARRITATLRTSDTAARLGGDEFVLIVECLNDALSTEHVSKKIMLAVSQPVELNPGLVVTVGASVGQAIYPKCGTEFQHMLHIADQAMFARKEAAHSAGLAAQVP